MIPRRQARPAVALALAAMVAACAPAPERPAEDVAGASERELEALRCVPAALQVGLPVTAGSAMELVDRRSGLRARIALDGARPVRASVAGALVRYEAAWGDGADVLLRVTETGVEDSIVLERGPPRARARWLVDASGVAGVRLVARTLELLDAAGAPRLRMAPPYLVDERARRIAASVEITGCAYDVDPRPPWGRAPIPPGSASCAVDVSWEGAEVEYPAVLDPLWVDGGTMAEARVTRAVSLEDGRVLLAGGQTAFDVRQSVEIFDPASRTWASTSDMPWPRYAAGVARVGGSVLVSGGCTATGPASCAPAATAALFDVALAQWTPIDDMAAPRAMHRAFALPGGGAIVVGGRTSDEPMTGALATTELLDPATGTWAPGAPMGTARDLFGAAVLPDGRVAVVGGIASAADDPLGLASAELYDPASAAWEAAPDAPYPRRSPSVTALVDGRLLVLGGVSLSPLASADLYDPATRTWASTGAAAVARLGHTARLLANGWVLAAGGVGGDGTVAELLSPHPTAGDSWSLTAALPEGRASATTALLPGGGVLIAGGWAGASDVALASAVVFEPRPVENACSVGGECVSGACVDGVCCAEACDGPCRACAVQAGGAEDGACTPVSAGLPDPRGLCGADEVTCGESGTCAEGGVCAMADAGTPCACPEQGEGACDGDGSCQCDAAACLDESTLRDAEGREVDCAPHRCAGGRCATPCSSSLDCLPGYGCDRDRACTPLEPAAPPPESCGCRVAGLDAPWRWAPILLVLPLARRFARRRSSAHTSRAARPPR